MKVVDLIGKKFHDLTVTMRAGSDRYGKSTWLCKCDCGRETVFSGDHLTRKKQPVKSCGCKSVRYGMNHPQWNGVGEISGNWWYNHILRERKQTSRPKINVSLTIQEAWDLFIKQERKCALSKMDISFSDKTASLDRIDSNGGYVANNIQLVHKDINLMKNHFNEDYFIEVCKKIVLARVT